MAKVSHSNSDDSDYENNILTTSKEDKPSQLFFTSFKVDIDYDDTEGLITNLGVISALILGFMIGLIFTIPSEELEYGNYRYAIRYDLEYRNNILNYLDHLQFDYTIFGESFIKDLNGYNIKEILQDCPILSLDYYSEISILWEKRLDTVFHLTKNVDGLIEYANILDTTLSDKIYILGSVGSLFGVLSLGLSIILYVALCLSQAREDKSLITLNLFNSVALPMIFTGYVCMFASMVIFGIVSCNIVGARSPSFTSFLFYRNGILLPVLVPAAGIGVLLCIYSVYISQIKNNNLQMNTCDSIDPQALTNTQIEHDSQNNSNKTGVTEV